MQSDPIKPIVEKIARECEEAGASKWQALRIIKELSAEEKGTEQKLKEHALALLQTINPEAAKVFASFAKMHVHTSRQLIENFDRGNIVKSLLLETHANRTIAEKIGAEVEDKIKDLKISHLTTALVREMVNAKLLEYGLESLRTRYSRLGMPVADIEKEIEKGLFENRQVLTEYALDVFIPNELSEQHFKADLHFCNIGDFCTKPLALSVLPAAKEQNLEELLPKLLLDLNKKKSFFSLPLNVECFNFVLAQALREQSETKARKSAIFAFDCLRSGSFIERAHSITLDFFTPEKIENALGLKKTALLFANAIIERAPSEKNNLVIAVDSKFALKAMDESAFEKELVFLNCSKEEFSTANQNIAFNGTQGLLGMVGLNLEKLGFSSTGKESMLETQLLEKLEAAKKIMELKKTELEKRAYLQENNIEVAALKPVLGIFGLENAAMFFLEKKEFDKEATGFAEKTVKKIKEFLGAGWILSDFNDAEGIKRFVAQNEKEFSHQNAVQQNFAAAKEFSVLAQASSRQELEHAIDAGAKIVKFLPRKN